MYNIPSPKLKHTLYSNPHHFLKSRQWTPWTKEGARPRSYNFEQKCVETFRNSYPQGAAVT